MLVIPAGEIIIHLDDDEDLIDLEIVTAPNVFFRKGGLKRPREDDDPFENSDSSSMQLSFCLYISDTKVIVFQYWRWLVVWSLDYGGLQEDILRVARVYDNTKF
jgi:hypothetical protein